MMKVGCVLISGIANQAHRAGLIECYKRIRQSWSAICGEAQGTEPEALVVLYS